MNNIFFRLTKMKIPFPHAIMTKNNKNACGLLLSVLFLFGVVKGIAEPLKEKEHHLISESKAMQQEIQVYQDFSENAHRDADRARKLSELRSLQAALPDMLNTDKIVKQLYNKADDYDIVIQKMKSLQSNEAGKLVWDAEFFGTWNALLCFLKDLEKQAPFTRLNHVRIYKSQKDNKLIMQAHINIYYLSDI